MLDPELLRWLRDTPGAKVTLTWKNGNYWCASSVETRPYVERVVAVGEASTVRIASEVVAHRLQRQSAQGIQPAELSVVPHCERVIDIDALPFIDGHASAWCAKPATHTVLTGHPDQWSICAECLSEHHRRFGYEFDGLQPIQNPVAPPEATE